MIVLGLKVHGKEIKIDSKFFDQEIGEMRLNLASVEPKASAVLQSASLQLTWSHPTNSDKDFTLTLMKTITAR